MQEDKIICRTCGATYYASAVRCPYCGTADDAAEEEEYMGRLEDIREDLQQQPEKGNRRINMGMCYLISGTLLVIVIIIMLLFSFIKMSSYREKNHSDQKKQEFLQEVTDK